MDGSMVSDLWCRIQYWRTVHQECWLTHCHSLDIIYVLVFHCIVFTRCLVVMWPDSVVFSSASFLHYMRVLSEMPRSADNSCEKKKTKKTSSRKKFNLLIFLYLDNAMPACSFQQWAAAAADSYNSIQKHTFFIPYLFKCLNICLCPWNFVFFSFFVAFWSTNGKYQQMNG